LGVTKQLLVFLATLVLFAQANHALAQNDGLRDPLATHCGPPFYPIEAARYELEGTTWLAVDLDDAGRPSQVRLHRGSGWKVLDDMALRILKNCRFDPAGDSQVRRRDIKMAYKWALAPSAEKAVAASLVAGSCQASDRFSAFRALSGDVTGSEGVLVRFLVDPAGKPFGIKFESDTPPASQQAGAAWLASCSFTPAQGKAGPARGQLYGRLIPKTV
jgi:TonB family protein